MSKINRFWIRGVALAAAVLLSGGVSHAVTLVIDDFADLSSDYIFTVNSVTPSDSSGFLAITGAGESRNVEVDLLSVGGSITSYQDQLTEVGKQFYDSSTSARGTMRITYDALLDIDLTVNGGLIVALQVDGDISISPPLVGFVTWRLHLTDSSTNTWFEDRTQTDTTPPDGGYLFYALQLFIDNGVDVTMVDTIVLELLDTNAGDDLALMSLVVVSAVPEPATITLLGLGLLGSAAASRRRRRAEKQV